MPIHPDDRFCNSIEATSPQGCWHWKGYVNASGYGVFAWKKKRTGAHRYAWAFFNGQPIPEGKMVIHRCNNPICVNPLHLRIGTHLENMADRLVAGHYPRGEKHFNTKLSDKQAADIFMDPRSCKAIANDYGIDRTVVDNIRSGQTWAHINGGGRSPVHRRVTDSHVQVAKNWLLTQPSGDAIVIRSLHRWVRDNQNLFRKDSGETYSRPHILHRIVRPEGFCDWRATLTDPSLQPSPSTP